MRTRMIAAALASYAAGLALVRAAPRPWRLDSWQGVLLGTALYMGVLHRWLEGPGAARPLPAQADAWNLAGRVAFFIGLLVFQAYAYFEWLPPADLRAPFVMLSGWVVTESLFANRPRVGVERHES